MAISEAQLETWARLGAVAQSKATYDTVKGVLNSSSSPYYLRSFDIFLQGSYGNDTNIYADSDVDIVIRTSSVFYHDIDNSTPELEVAFKREFPGVAQYNVDHFRSDVLSWLQTNYGSLVRDGNKAIFVRGDGSRRDVDVLACAEYRRYFTFSGSQQNNRADGIVFWTKNGVRIVNFPKQHASNCTAKHQATNGWFKPTVRMLKNMRNKMIEERRIVDGLAPSYFLEGLLYNVPDSKFGQNFQTTFVNSSDWLRSTDRSGFVCANGLHWLFQDGSPTSWRSSSCAQFLDALQNFWNGR